MRETGAMAGEGGRGLKEMKAGKRPEARQERVEETTTQSVQTKNAEPGLLAGKLVGYRTCGCPCHSAVHAA